MGKERSRGRHAVGLTLVFAFVAVTAVACVPAPPPPPSIVFYGDSITSETQSYVEFLLAKQRPGWRRYFRTYGGTAICDYLDEMRADGNLNAKVVVIQFSGNALSPCMAGIAPETLNWYLKYRSDATTAASIWKARGTRVLFVGNLRGVCATPPHQLDATYRSVATQYGMRFTDAPSLALTVVLEPAAAGSAAAAPPAVYAAGTKPEPTLVAASSWPCSAPTAPTRVFAFQMPCLSFEDAAHGCVGGMITVRDGTASSPGGHFDRHGTYSSGAWRFGGAIANAAAALMI